jgi:hypothetical protein
MKYSIGLIRSAPKKPPIFLRFRSSEALIISTVSLAIFTDIFLYGVVSIFVVIDVVGSNSDIAVRVGIKSWYSKGVCTV